MTGRGGHAAQPHLTRDPVLAASAIVLALQGLVSRETVRPFRQRLHRNACGWCHPGVTVFFQHESQQLMHAGLKNSLNHWQLEEIMANISSDHCQRFWMSQRDIEKLNNS